VQRGPYRLIRHPSYTGGLLALVGAGLTRDNWLSLAALTLLPLAGVLVRIRYEEARLRDAFGADYRRYASRTARLVPGVW
jgi:protein-S-isoprenylcysteine O-methyltransferase Ste14